MQPPPGRAGGAPDVCEACVRAGPFVPGGAGCHRLGGHPEQSPQLPALQPPKRNPRDSCGWYPRLVDKNGEPHTACGTGAREAFRVTRHAAPTVQERDVLQQYAFSAAASQAIDGVFRPNGGVADHVDTVPGRRPIGYQTGRVMGHPTWFVGLPRRAVCACVQGCSMIPPTVDSGLVL